MMKLAATVLSLFLVLNPSQAKTSADAKVLGFHKHSASKNLTRTKSALVRAVPKAQRRLLVAKDLTDSDNGPPGPGELDLQSPYRRPKVSTTVANLNTELPKYVRIRLALAREKALDKHRKHWA